MSKITCFLAAPISAFADEDEYKEYRVKVLKLITAAIYYRAKHKIKQKMRGGSV